MHSSINVYRFQDEHTRAWFLYIAGGEWLGLNAELLSATFLTTATIAAVITSADAGFTGLALYSAVNLTQIIYVAVNNSVHFESLMTSVERVFEYCKLQPEPGYKIQVKPKGDWPQEGSILCESLSLRYLDDGPKTLKDVTFAIKAKEKVCFYVTLHYIRLHYITSHYIALDYTALHVTSHYARFIALHYITSHNITSHHTTLHYITLHHFTLHYITSQNITLHNVT